MALINFIFAWSRYFNIQMANKRCVQGNPLTTKSKRLHKKIVRRFHHEIYARQNYAHVIDDQMKCFRCCFFFFQLCCVGDEHSSDFRMYARKRKKGTICCGCWICTSFTLIWCLRSTMCVCVCCVWIFRCVTSSMRVHIIYTNTFMYSLLVFRVILEYCAWT